MTPPRHKALSAYRSVELETRAPQHDQHQLVTMMFETVLDSLTAARGAIEKGDTATKIKQIDKAMRIIQEGLRTSLDLENGGELAANLASIYDYSVVRLAQANAANDVAKLNEVTELIKPVYEAWTQISQNSAGGPGSSSEGSAKPQAASDNSAGSVHSPKNQSNPYARSMAAYGGAMLMGA